jgi:hypothetical protein
VQLASLESKRLSHDTNQLRDRTIRQLHLLYHLIEPTVIAADLIIVVAINLLAGIGYNWVFLGVVPATATQTYTATGVLTFTNVSAVLAARGDYRVNDLVRFYQEVRHLTILWTGALGLGGMIARRGVVAQFLGQALSAGAFAPRKVILIGEQSHLPNLVHDIGNAAMRLHPRVTRLGCWLRRTHIDKLPPLFSVLYGDMSLVGPRSACRGSQQRIREAHRRLCFSTPRQTGYHRLGAGEWLSGRNSDH